MLKKVGLGNESQIMGTPGGIPKPLGLINNIGVPIVYRLLFYTERLRSILKILDTDFKAYLFQMNWLLNNTIFRKRNSETKDDTQGFALTEFMRH